MQIKALKNIFHQELGNQYDKNEIDEFFYRILAHYFDIEKITIALTPEYSLTNSEVPTIYNALNQLKKNIPIQYILGKTNFYGADFKVNNHVLIPRPETEELVGWILSDIQNSALKDSLIHILDIGTGSGCIAVSLAMNTRNAQVSAVDVSEVALKIAQENALRLKANITLEKLDILKTNQLSERYHIIVSNPPYVRNQEKTQMQPNVLDHEPHLALFVPDDDALVFYKKIGQLAIHNLFEGGALYFEINQYLAESLEYELKKIGFSQIQLKKDIFGNHRMLKAQI